METLSTTPHDLHELSVDDLIHRPGVYIVRVTPEAAASLLERNTLNRHPKANAIERYAKSMREGKWRVTNQGLGISRSGVLVDGQNRLMACIEAGVPFETVLSTGMDDEARDVVDVGVRRSLGDSLRMAGYTNAVALAGGVALRMRYEQIVKSGQAWTQARSMMVSHDEALAYAKDHPELVDHTATAWVIRKAFIRVPISVIVAFESLAYEHDPYKAEEFRNGLVTGANLEMGDPRLVLRNYLMRREERYKKGRDAMHLLGIFIKAFNDFVNDDKRELITLKDTEAMPTVGMRRRPRPNRDAKWDGTVEVVDGEVVEVEDDEPDEGEPELRKPEQP